MVPVVDSRLLLVIGTSEIDSTKDQTKKEKYDKKKINKKRRKRKRGSEKANGIVEQVGRDEKDSQILDIVARCPHGAQRARGACERAHLRPNVPE